MIGYVMQPSQFSPTRGRRKSATGTKNCFRHASLHQTSIVAAHNIAFARHTMLTRILPRAAPWLSTFAQCETLAARQKLVKLPTQKWQPAQQQLQRRHASTFREQFKEQYRKSPILFPFAVTV